MHPHFTDPTQRFLDSFREGKPSTVVQPFAKRPVYLAYCRVSLPEQAEAGNIQDSERFLREKVQEIARGALFIPYHDIGSASVRGGLPWLREPVELAKQLKKLFGSATILTETFDRIARPYDFDPTCPIKKNKQCTVADLRMLDEAREGIELMNVIHPDTSPREIRSHQRKRGQDMKGNKGGRPPGSPQERRVGTPTRSRRLWPISWPSINSETVGRTRTFCALQNRSRRAT